MPARPRSMALSAGALIVLLAAPAPAIADRAPSVPAPAPSAEARKEAARKFEEGTRAFDAGDFTRAGQAFEAAYELAPHEDPLWNAARAWHRAGETAHAATLYARYLRDAPATARDRTSATTSLAQLSTKLARLEIHLDAGVEAPEVDGAAVDGPVVFVTPGMHVVRARGPHGDVESRQNVEAGARVSILLAPPVDPPPPVSPPPPPAPASGTSRVAPAETVSLTSGWSPLVAAVGAGATLVLTGGAVWSGLDTLHTLHLFEATPSRQGLEDGRALEVRTNVLIGAAVGLAALTAVTAIWLVDWGKRAPSSTGASAGRGAATLGGRF